MPIYGIVSYGIDNGLNLRVVPAEDESAAAWKFINDWQQKQEDGKLYFVDMPSYNLPTKRERKIRLSEYGTIALLVGEVFDIKPGRYGRSTLLRGDSANVLRNILRRDSGEGRRIIARIETAPFQFGTTKIKACKWIVSVDKGGIGVRRALR